MKQKPFPKEHSRGYTLLFAMIVATVVLSIGVTILTVSRKEFILASSASESSSAFYAADSGLGCAEYWDQSNNNIGIFPTSSPESFPVACNGTTVPVTKSSPTFGPGDCQTGECDFTFSTPFSTDGTKNFSCADITVAKYFDKESGDAAPRLYTQITSNGYNIGWEATMQGEVVTGDCLVISPKKVERSIQLTY